jgi:hypothetical protein
MQAVIPIKNPVERYQRIMVAGRAMMYRILCVKFRRRNRFPRKPQIREATFSQ